MTTNEQKERDEVKTGYDFCQKKQRYGYTVLYQRDDESLNLGVIFLTER